MVDDICDSMLEDELELLTVASADLELRGKKVFIAIITEADDFDNEIINEIEEKLK